MLLLYYQNVNRIRTKTHDVYMNVLANDYDIICFTETNLNNSVHDAELIDSRYNVFRRDRESSASHKTEGGGLLVAVKNSIRVVRRMSWETGAEDLWLTLCLNSDESFNINLCLVYLPPDADLGLVESFFIQCCNVLSDSQGKFIILGDFNMPHISWSRISVSEYLSASVTRRDRKSDFLLELLALGGLNQLNDVAKFDGRILDLFILNFSNTALLPADPISIPDKHHPPFMVNISNTTVRDIPCNRNKGTFNFRKCDLDGCRAELQAIDWDAELSRSDTHGCLSSFYRILNNVISKYTKETIHINTHYGLRIN